MTVVPLLAAAALGAALLEGHRTGREDARRDGPPGAAGVRAPR